MLYFFVRNIIVHTFPFVASVVTTFMSDVVYLESDWWLNFDLGVAYVFVNYATTQYSGTDEVYYFNWGTKDQSIGAYSPLFDSTVLGLIAFAIHFMMCLITQVFHQRFESDFGDFIEAENDPEPEEEEEVVEGEEIAVVP